MRSKWIDVLLVIIVCGFVAFLVWKYKHPGPIIGDERGGAASVPMMAPSQPTSTPMMATDTAATGTTGTMMMSETASVTDTMGTSAWMKTEKRVTKKSTKK